MFLTRILMGNLLACTIRIQYEMPSKICQVPRMMNDVNEMRRDARCAGTLFHSGARLRRGYQLHLVAVRSLFRPTPTQPVLSASCGIARVGNHQDFWFCDGHFSWDDPGFFVAATGRIQGRESTTTRLAAGWEAELYPVRTQ